MRITGCIFGEKRFGWVAYFSQISDTSQLRSVNHTITKLIKRFGLEERINLKSLIKTFYELRRGDITSHKYIPTFDNLHIKQQREIVSMWIGDKEAKSINDHQITKKFYYKVAIEVKELDEDISGLS